MACLIQEGCWKPGMYNFPVLWLSAGLSILMVDGFPCSPGNLFASLIYYFEEGDVGMGAVVWFTVDVNCTGYMAAVFLHSIFLTSAGLTHVRFTTNFFRTGPFVNCILFEVQRDFIFRNAQVWVSIFLSIHPSIYIYLSGHLSILYYSKYNYIMYKYLLYIQNSENNLLLTSFHSLTWPLHQVCMGNLMKRPC